MEDFYRFGKHRVLNQIDTANSLMDLLCYVVEKKKVPGFSSDKTDRRMSLLRSIPSHMCTMFRK